MELTNKNAALTEQIVEMEESLARSQLLYMQSGNVFFLNVF